MALIENYEKINQLGFGADPVRDIVHVIDQEHEGDNPQEPAFLSFPLSRELVPYSQRVAMVLSNPSLVEKEGTPVYEVLAGAYGHKIARAKNERDWLLRYVWNGSSLELSDESRIAHSISMSTAIEIQESLRWSVLFDIAIAQLKQANVEFPDIVGYVQGWTEKKALIAAQRRDLDTFLILYFYINDDSEERSKKNQTVSDFLLGQYVQRSLKRKKSESSGKLLRKDMGNWVAVAGCFAALGYKDPEEIAKVFDLEDRIGEIQRLRESILLRNEGYDLSAVLGEGKYRVIGRIHTFQYIDAQILQGQELLLVIKKVVISQLLGLDPFDPVDVAMIDRAAQIPQFIETVLYEYGRQNLSVL